MEEAPQAAPAPPPRQRSSALLAILAVLLVGGSAVGVVFYQLSSGREKPALETSGFDISQALAGPKVSGPSAPAAEAQSGLMPIKTGMANYIDRGPTEADLKAAAEAKLKAQAKRAEAIIESLAAEYMARYPMVKQFALDWWGHPDLRYMSVRYYYDRDPGYFLRRLAESPSFPGMVKKYAMQAPLQSFVKDAVKRLPPESLTAGWQYVEKEKAAKPVVDNLLNAMGIPPQLVGGGGSGAPKVDANAVMDSVMKNNPEAQKAMSDPETQKAMKSAQGSPQR